MNLKGSSISTYSLSTMPISQNGKFSSKNSFEDCAKSELLLCNEEKNKSLSVSEERQRIKYVRWTSEEDTKLKEIFMSQSNKDWNKIAEKFSNKNGRQCMYRWYKVIKPCMNFKLSREEESDIHEYVRANSITNMTKLAKKIKKNLPSKIIKEKYYTLFGKEEPLTINEEILLLLLVKKSGTTWTKFSENFLNRSENFIKNRFYSILRRKAGLKLGCDKARFIKAKDLLAFLNETIDDYAMKIGIEKSQIIYHSVFPEKCEQIMKNENTDKIEINLCNHCLAKLRMNLKKRIIEKIIQKGLLGSLNYQLDFPISNFSI